jgi:drug/metabolite transporter (DMT)-like permease
MKFSKRHLALLALAASSIIWGAAAPIFKWSMQEVPPYTLAFLRFMLASLLILPFVYKKIAIKQAHFYKILFLAFIGITLHIALFLLGLQLTTSINIPIINATTPLFLMLGAVVYLHEKLKLRVILGTLLGMAGILLIILEPLLISGPDGSIPGNTLVLLSVICVVVYTLYLKKLALPYSTLTILFWVFFLGGLLFIPAFLTELALLNPLPSMDTKAWIGIIYGAIFSSAFGYFFYNFSLKYVTGGEIGIFTYLEPIATIAIALPLLGEKINSLYVLGSLIVFASIFIAEGRLRYHPHHPHHAHHKHDPLK